MAGHLHKSFSDRQIRALLRRYVDQEIQLQHILGILKIGHSRFFEILKDFREDPRGFTVAYQRKGVRGSSPRRSRRTSSGSCASRSG
jgi:sulfite reductase alpha subunit-like flavoprotein